MNRKRGRRRSRSTRNVVKELMQYLVLAFAALAFAVFAPLKVTLSLIAVIGIALLVVKVTAGKVIGPISVKDAARSVAWAFSLLTGAVLCALWWSQGQLQLEGVAAVVFISALFAAFVLGFKIALEASFGASAAIAAVSTLVSAVLLFALRPVLF
jgi:hypothetical protein